MDGMWDDGTGRWIGAGLVAAGVTAGLPIVLAQMDAAGLIGVFGIDLGDAPAGLTVVAGVGGILTALLLAGALVGAGLALAGRAGASALLIGVAVAGIATAGPLWAPVGVVIGAGALMVRRAERRPAGPADPVDGGA